jgi:hypothetical protein
MIIPDGRIQVRGLSGSYRSTWGLMLRCAMVNRTQALVLGFFLMALASLLAILLAAPEVYDQALRLPGTGRCDGDRLPGGTDCFHHVAGGRCRAAVALGVLADPGRVPGRGAACASGHLAVDRCPARRHSNLVCRLPGPYWSGPARHRTGHAGRLSTLRRLGSLLTEQRPCHAGGAATRETQGPWPCPALSVLRAKRLLLATALGGARQVSGRPPALRLGQAALGFTRSE